MLLTQLPPPFEVRILDPTFEILLKNVRPIFGTLSDTELCKLMLLVDK